jgi:hypothetical protein
MDERRARILQKLRIAESQPRRTNELGIDTRHAENQYLGKARGAENRPQTAMNPLPPSSSDPSGSGQCEAPREIVLQIAGKNPTRDEVAAGFIEMNQPSAKSLRTSAMNTLGKPIVIYREIHVSAVQIKGKRGTTFVSIESLGTFPNSQAGSPAVWKEESLEFEKTKRGWVMSPVEEAVYVSREVALQILSARLAELAQNTSTSSEQEREQKQIIRFLNTLIPDNSGPRSAQNN